MPYYLISLTRENARRLEAMLGSRIEIVPSQGPLDGVTGERAVVSGLDAITDDEYGPIGRGPAARCITPAARAAGNLIARSPPCRPARRASARTAASASTTAAGLSGHAAVSARCASGPPGPTAPRARRARMPRAEQEHDMTRPEPAAVSISTTAPAASRTRRTNHVCF